MHTFKMEPGESAASTNTIKTINHLRDISNAAYKRRVVRSVLMGATSALYLHLYSTGDNDYDTLVYPGVALVGLTLFRLMSQSPEEKTYNHYQLKTSVHISPLPGGGMAQIVYQF